VGGAVAGALSLTGIGAVIVIAGFMIGGASLGSSNGTFYGRAIYDTVTQSPAPAPLHTPRPPQALDPHPGPHSCFICVEP
jgi:hypothetical protein